MIEIIPNWHPIFVHFSVGLLLTAAAFHVAAVVTGREALKQTFTTVANWNLWVGTVLTVATVTAGWIAFNSVEHDTPSHLAMLEHRNWALVTFAAFLAVAIWSLSRAKKHLPIQWPLTIAVGVAGLLLISTAWHGGELVYRHGLGVMSLPNPDEHAHAAGVAHDHGGESHEHEPAHEHEHEHEHDQEMSDSMQTDSHTPSPESGTTEQSESNHTHEPGQEHHDH
jgi:uncharacterized membrane protein